MVDCLKSVDEIVRDYEKYLSHHSGFVPTHKENDKITIKLSAGTISLHRKNGRFEYGKVRGALKIKSMQFRIIEELLCNKYHMASYEYLLGDRNNKVARREIQGEVKNLKKALGILPKKTRVNADIIMNMSTLGYQLDAAT
jgi:hypothetical protein